MRPWQRIRQRPCPPIVRGVGRAALSEGDERVPTRIFLVPSASDQDAVDAITEKLEQVVGVLKVDVTYHNGEVRVRFQKPANETTLIKAIEMAGYPVTQ
jgi:copper chaperone CopZ